MMDSIEGNCAFTQEQAKKRMDAVQSKADELTQKVSGLRRERLETESPANEIKEQPRQPLS